ncbi:MAG: hypothetical protein ABFC88_12675 [Thermoguttaceae bacterium]
MHQDFDQPGKEPAPTALASPPSASINLKALKRDTVLLLEGESDIYELTLRYPEHGIVEITSNLPALRTGTVGQFMFSVRWSNPGERLDVIRQGWAMTLRFKNGEYQTQPIMAASARGIREDGSHWHYDVF